MSAASHLGHWDLHRPPITNGPAGPQYLYNDVRMMATGTLNATNPNWLRISMSPSTGNGGT